jgi:hypothetical protein
MRKSKKPYSNSLKTIIKKNNELDIGSFIYNVILTSQDVLKNEMKDKKKDSFYYGVINTQTQNIFLDETMTDEMMFIKFVLL